MTSIRIAVFLLSAVWSIGAHPAEPARDLPWWWDHAWWDEGQIEPAQNYRVIRRAGTYRNGDTEIQALVFRPDARGKFPAVLYAHGRRGLDDVVQADIRRLAARGFVVVAPDLYSSRFVNPFPIEHDPALEEDLNKGVDYLLSLPDVSTRKACLASMSRGGYVALRVAVKFGRQDKDIACYVGWYPHLQDPNAPEPLQVYSFAPEVEQLRIPTLIFIGETEQYQRRRNIEESVKVLEGLKRPVHLIVYPGVGRGFDFRPHTVRTFADDLAAKDSMQRAAIFIRTALAP